MDERTTDKPEDRNEAPQQQAAQDAPAATEPNELDGQDPKQQAADKPKRSIGVWVGAVVALLLVGAGIFVFSGAGRSILARSHMSSLERAMEESARLRAQEDDFRIQVSPDDLSVNPDLPDGWLHVLLLGTDMGGEQTTHGRTDAMLVLSVEEKSGQMKLTSLIRDMLVPIPGASRGAKINAANAYGGPLLAVKTVNQMLNLNIERYCLVDFAGFMDVVNLMGGSWVELTEAEAREVGAEKEEGPQHLNGWQTLAFARIRRLDNNFGRNERQRKVLSALLSQARALDTNTLMRTVSESMQHLATNLSSQELLSLINSVLRNRNPLQMLSLPPEGKYRYTQTHDGASAVGFNSDTVRNAFFDFVYGPLSEAEASLAP